MTSYFNSALHGFASFIQTNTIAFIIKATALKFYKKPHPWLFNQLFSLLIDPSMQIFWSLEDMKYAQEKITNHKDAMKGNEALFFLLLMTYMKNANMCMCLANQFRSLVGIHPLPGGE